MKLLYAPWRSDYSANTAHTKNDNTPADACIFCVQLAQQDDAKHLIIRRFTYAVVMMNLYPYNAGHLMILPYAHQAFLHHVDQYTRGEIMELTMHSVTILTTVLGAQGVNVGLNFGKAAGAGIPSHLHMHVLPRWIGDTNFLPVLSETKQISFDLRELYEKLAPAFQAIKIA